MNLYPWLVVAHVIAVVGFVLVHGISAGVALRIRHERERTRIHALLELSSASLPAMYVSFLLLLLTGIAAGITGGWFGSGRLWIWGSLAVFIAVFVAMGAVAVPFFDDVRQATGLRRSRDRGKEAVLPPEASDADLSVLLESRRPIAMAAVGVGGLALLTWLMVMKPF